MCQIYKCNSIHTLSKFIWYNASYELKAISISAVSGIDAKNLVTMLLEQLLLKLCLNDMYEAFCW